MLNLWNLEGSTQNMMSVASAIRFMPMCKYPHRVRQVLAEKIFGIPEQNIRVIAKDVGGGFGAKGWQYVEQRLMIWATRKIGRPVKWTCERSECVQADEYGRDNVTEAEIALEREWHLSRPSCLHHRKPALIFPPSGTCFIFTNVGTLVGVYKFQ